MQEVFNLLQDSPKPNLIIGADTIVTYGETIYGKPKDEQDALQILTK